LERKGGGWGAVDGVKVGLRWGRGRGGVEVGERAPCGQGRPGLEEGGGVGLEEGGGGGVGRVTEA
jgi:hypothetical protein